MVVMATKDRLSVSVDAKHVAAGRAAVAAGRSESLSAWVSAALERQAEHETRMRALDELFTDYEARFGVITDEEVEAARRSSKERAIVIRGGIVETPGRPQGVGG